MLRSRWVGGTDAARAAPHDGLLGCRCGANIEAVQRTLGHASAAMTPDVYAGLSGDDLDDLLDRLDRAAMAAAANQVRADEPRDDGRAAVGAAVGAAGKALTCTFSGGPGQIRTGDTRFRKPMLYPLSYGAVGSCPGARVPDRFRSAAGVPTPVRSSARRSGPGPQRSRTEPRDDHRPADRHPDPRPRGAPRARRAPGDGASRAPAARRLARRCRVVPGRLRRGAAARRPQPGARPARARPAGRRRRARGPARRGGARPEAGGRAGRPGSTTSCSTTPARPRSTGRRPCRAAGRRTSPTSWSAPCSTPSGPARSSGARTRGSGWPRRWTWCPAPSTATRTAPSTACAAPPVAHLSAVVDRPPADLGRPGRGQPGRRRCRAGAGHREPCHRHRVADGEAVVGVPVAWHSSPPPSGPVAALAAWRAHAAGR